jgi:hypothetical protein
MQEHKDPTQWLPGSVGEVYWVPGKAGLAKKYQISRLDAGLIGEMQALQSAQVSNYNSKKSSYDKLRGKYDEAIEKEQLRLKDFFAAGFDKAIEIPKRPSAPTKPKSYSGPSNLGAVLTVTRIASTTHKDTTKTWGVLESTDVAVTSFETDNYKGIYPFHKTMDMAYTDVTVASMRNRMGFMSVAAESSATETAITSTIGYAGRVFGRLGQGDDNLPGSLAPFSWKDAVATEFTGMMISFFPYESTETGMAVAAAATKVIKMEVEPKAWGTMASELKAPSSPSSAKEPADALCSAAYLAATSTAAVALALTTLF